MVQYKADHVFLGVNSELLNVAGICEHGHRHAVRVYTQHVPVSVCVTCEPSTHLLWAILGYTESRV